MIINNSSDLNRNRLKIKVERSGGLTGMPISKEMDVKDLPSALMRTAEEIIEGKNLPLFNKASPKGAADHYNYKISIKNGKNRRVIECNQYNISDDIRLLVKFIENNRTKY